ncbi:MAG TPA: rod shape-determining protein MreC [Candidatus Pelagibacter sp.]|jgi:rod shape-determining protein MreC|nr:rod shape-determining protein MreC [Candidatus Pelagibacter sp.]
MDTSRDDIGIVIRSAFLKRGSQQRFSLFVLIIFSIILIYVETIKSKPFDYLRSFIKDTIYRGSVIVSSPAKGIKIFSNSFKAHMKVFEENSRLKEENKELKDKKYNNSFLIVENNELKKIIDEKKAASSNLVTARVILDKKSPYLNSFIIGSGGNKKIKNSMSVLDGLNFIGRIVNVNFFSSRILLITDLNSKIPVVIEPGGYNAILSGRGDNRPALDYLPKNHTLKSGNKVYTSGKEGIFKPGIPIGEVILSNSTPLVNLASDINQITFVNIDLGSENN